MRDKPLNMVELVKTIELPPDCLDFLDSPRSFEYLKKAVEQFKETVKQQRKKLALKHHPDKGGDPDRMKEINDVCDLLMKLKAVRPRPLVYPVFRFGFSVSSHWTGSTTSNTWNL